MLADIGMGLATSSIADSMSQPPKALLDMDGETESPDSCLCLFEMLMYISIQQSFNLYTDSNSS